MSSVINAQSDDIGRDEQRDLVRGQPRDRDHIIKHGAAYKFIDDPWDPWREKVSFPEKDRKAQPKWIVVAGRRVVPGSVYRVSVEALRPYLTGALQVRAALIHGREQVASAKTILQPGDVDHLLMQVPDKSVGGMWQLRVEGTQGSTKLFHREETLRFDPNFLTILIQPSRPVYNAGQTVRFRVIMLTKELKPYDDPVDVYVL
ncbi:unnamed protein product, partial [Meganyctiphanes norvegica]